MSARHLAGCDTRGGNWICAAGCPVAPQRTEKETTVAEPTTEKAALHSIWRDLAEKRIEAGVDWPRIVLDLFRDLDALLDTIRGHETMRWPDEAHRLQQQRNEAVRQLDALRERIEATIDASMRDGDPPAVIRARLRAALRPAASEARR